MTKRRQRWKRGREVSSSLFTKRGLAQQVGMSLHQMRQCVRVANIPEDEFTRLASPTIRRR